MAGMWAHLTFLIGSLLQTYASLIDALSSCMSQLRIPSDPESVPHESTKL